MAFVEGRCHHFGGTDIRGALNGNDNKMFYHLQYWCIKVIIKIILISSTNLLSSTSLGSMKCIIYLKSFTNIFRISHISTYLIVPFLLPGKLRKMNV